MAFLALIFFLALFLSKDFSVYGSECCESYTDSYGDWHGAEWCSDYCCYKLSTSIYSILRYSTDLECCSNSLRQALYSRRQDTCAAWWSDHTWVPVLISIGCIGAISLCCFGCIKLCSGNNNRTGVMIQNPQQPAVIMMANHGQQPYPSSSVQNPAAYPPGGVYPPGGAYPQGVAYPPGVANPGVPPKYDSVVPPPAV